MSKTIRHYIGGPGHDGKQDWRTRIARDDRGTFLRTDKANRIAAKASLKSGGGDSPPGGKRRRYSDRYGSYMLQPLRLQRTGLSLSVAEQRHPGNRPGDGPVQACTSTGGRADSCSTICDRDEEYNASPSSRFGTPP